MITYPEAKKYAPLARKVDLAAFLKSRFPKSLIYDPQKKRYRDSLRNELEIFKGDDGYYHYKNWETRERASDGIEFLIRYRTNPQTNYPYTFFEAVEALLDFAVEQKLKEMDKTALYDTYLK